MHAGPPQPHQPQPPYGAPVPGLRKSSGAVPSLVLGVSGLVTLPTVVFCCPVIPLPFAILAIFLGLQAKREIAANPSLGGAQEAKVGYVLGIVSLVLTVLVTVLAIAFLGVAIATSES